MTLNLSLPTREDTVRSVCYTEAHILDALAQIDPQIEYRVASRELALAKTKLQEALMWLRASSFYQPMAIEVTAPEVTDPSLAATGDPALAGSRVSEVLTEGQAHNAPQHEHRANDDPAT